MVSPDSSIRAKVVNHLGPSFSTIAEAEAHYNLSLSGQTRVPAKKKTGFDKCTQTTCPSSDSTERHSSRVTVATVMESSTQTTDDEHIPIPAAASEIPIMELGVNVTDRNLVVRCCYFFIQNYLINIARRCVSFGSY